jgi:hypothetical protein
VQYLLVMLTLIVAAASYWHFEGSVLRFDPDDAAQSVSNASAP